MMPLAPSFGTLTPSVYPPPSSPSLLPPFSFSHSLPSLPSSFLPSFLPSSSLFAGLSRRKPKAHKPSLMKRLKLQKDAKQARAAGSVLVISHDRWFLEAVGTSVLELEAGRARFFAGPWHAWRAESAARELAAGRDIECMVLARAVRWHTEHRVLINGHKTVIFK